MWQNFSFHPPLPFAALALRAIEPVNGSPESLHSVVHSCCLCASSSPVSSVHCNLPSTLCLPRLRVELSYELRALASTLRASLAWPASSGALHCCLCRALPELFLGARPGSAWRVAVAVACAGVLCCQPPLLRSSRAWCAYCRRQCLLLYCSLCLVLQAA